MITIDNTVPQIFSIKINKSILKITPLFGYTSTADVWLQITADIIAIQVRTESYYQFSNVSDGTFQLIYWNYLENGSHYFDVYAYDEAGNYIIKQIILERDCKAPVIKIKQPKNDNYFYGTDILFEISIEESNLAFVAIEINGQTFVLETKNYIAGKLPYVPVSHTINITFIARDIFDNEVRENVVVYRSDVFEGVRNPSLDFRNLFTNVPLHVSILLGVVFVISVITKYRSLLRERKNESKIYMED